MAAGLLVAAMQGCLAQAVFAQSQPQTPSTQTQPQPEQAQPQTPSTQTQPQPAPEAKPSPWDLFRSAQAMAAGKDVPKDVAKARAIFESLMLSDDKILAGAAAMALSKLAISDLNDPKLAASAMERGIAVDYPWAMLAKAQSLAKGTPQEQKEAADLYLRAAKTSPTPDVEKAVYYALGQLYSQPGQLSSKKAIANYTRAAELGNPWALIALAGIYETGIGTKPKWSKAKEFYDKALALDTPEVKGAASVGLARLYSQPGHTDPKRAVSYLLEGQKHGSPWATMNLADRYLTGQGVKKSTMTGRRMLAELRASPDQNVSRSAAFQLGRSFAKPGKFRDFKQAEENFSYAVKKGDVWSAYFLAQLYVNDMPSKANRLKARKLLTTMAKSDDPQVRKAATGLLKKLR